MVVGGRCRGCPRQRLKATVKGHCHKQSSKSVKYMLKNLHTKPQHRSSYDCRAANSTSWVDVRMHVDRRTDGKLDISYHDEADARQ